MPYYHDTWLTSITDMAQLGLGVQGMDSSAAIRERLITEFELDLVGPSSRVLASLEESQDTLERELLDRPPSRWYQTGFLIPNSWNGDKADDSVDDEFAGIDGSDLNPRRKSNKATADDTGASESGPARRIFFPSSMGLSFLLRGESSLDVSATWADYGRTPGRSGDEKDENWTREPHQETIALSAAELTPASRVRAKNIPGSRGLMLRWHCRLAPLGQGYPEGARAISLFFTNERSQQGNSTADRDQNTAFQVELELKCPEGFLARQDPRRLRHIDDWDERVNALQYRDALEFGVGHNVSVDAVLHEGRCDILRSTWLPVATVEKVRPQIKALEARGVELDMDALDARASSGAETVQAALSPLVTAYEQWITGQEATPGLDQQNRETCRELLKDARNQARRIQRGIDALAEDDIRQAFAIANRVMAQAARQRFGVMKGKDPGGIVASWRPFQLAFVLMNLVSIARPTDPHGERDVVDLLFFPTGGGKTEAYLGLAAFTLVMRRLRHGGSLQSGGMSVLMRYTLRLLTLDQLGRASTLICALELERRRQPATLGAWPFEIGLWVGQSGTPNRMGAKGNDNDNTARSRVRKWENGGPKPIPIDTCPWCGVEFGKTGLLDSKPASTRGVFNLLRQGRIDENSPDELRVGCRNRHCAFTGNNHLPLVAVDDMLYRRLPAFVIATVDKFASLPWLGRTGKLFGNADHIVDRHGYFGPADGNDHKSGCPLGQKLDAPDLIIQDELHLISGPLGSMAGLYEAVIDALSSRSTTTDTEVIRPKIVASTATVRRAQAQLQSLFGRTRAPAIFPAPGPDRRDSFFSYTAPASEVPGRVYVGVSAPGRNLKALLLRAVLALMSTAEKDYKAAEKQRKQREKAGEPKGENPVDPYMTLLGYFNTIKELGITRRLLEEEVTSQLASLANKKRLSENVSRYTNRKIDNEPLELTSRVGTSDVSNTKARLEQSFDSKDRVDVALATNMISVGLDITRLGLMVMLGQPKTMAEYIQASSRVGRDEKKPGLVVVLLNPNRPRDRSHYEHFSYGHNIFYRDVEATSVTPYSDRALQRALPAIAVAMARHLSDDLSWAKHAGRRDAITAIGPELCELLKVRARNSTQLSGESADAFAEHVAKQLQSLLDSWKRVCEDKDDMLQYGNEEAEVASLLHTPLDPALNELGTEHARFVANWSLRDVEPSVALVSPRSRSEDEI